MRIATVLAVVSAYGAFVDALNQDGADHAMLRDLSATNNENLSEVTPLSFLSAYAYNPDPYATCSWGPNVCELTAPTNSLKLGSTCAVDVPVPSDNYVGDKRVNKYDNALESTDYPYIEITSAGPKSGLAQSIDASTGHLAWAGYMKDPTKSQNNIKFTGVGLYDMVISAYDYDRFATCEGCIAVRDTYRPRFKDGTCPPPVTGSLKLKMESISSLAKLEQLYGTFTSKGNRLNNPESDAACNIESATQQIFYDTGPAAFAGTCFNSDGVKCNVDKLKNNPFNTVENIKRPVLELEKSLNDKCSWCCSKSIALKELYTEYTCPSTTTQPPNCIDRDRHQALPAPIVDVRQVYGHVDPLVTKVYGEDTYCNVPDSDFSLFNLNYDYDVVIPPVVGQELERLKGTYKQSSVTFECEKALRLRRCLSYDCADKEKPGAYEACGGTIVSSKGDKTFVKKPAQETCCDDCDPDLNCVAFGSTEVKRCEVPSAYPYYSRLSAAEQTVFASGKTTAMALLAASAMVAVVALVVVKRRTSRPQETDDAYYPLLEFSTRDFDELMHIHTSTRSSRAASLVFSPLSSLKCCLILPCTANEDEIFRVGRNIHTTLKIKGSLYFQVVETPLPTSATSPRSDHLESPNEDENLTEERMRAATALLVVVVFYTFVVGALSLDGFENSTLSMTQKTEILFMAEDDPDLFCSWQNGLWCNLDTAANNLKLGEVNKCELPVPDPQKIFDNDFARFARSFLLKNPKPQYIQITSTKRGSSTTLSTKQTLWSQYLANPALVQSEIKFDAPGCTTWKLLAPSYDTDYRAYTADTNVVNNANSDVLCGVSGVDKFARFKLFYESEKDCTGSCFDDAAKRQTWQSSNQLRFPTHCKPHLLSWKPHLTLSACGAAEKPESSRNSLRPTIVQPTAPKFQAA
ncbi:hypothetical protein GQ600_5544 [Phytophthora cactorum]|nr:hypothetical protein GQ600_5544 [Phytophthora cactorum]